MKRHGFQLLFGAAFTVMALLPLILTAQQSPRQLFERARILEEGNQDLTEAVRLYGLVVEQAKGDRRLAAQALLHMAQIYGKLGSRRSERIYQRIMDEFGDQTEVVAIARLAGEQGDGPSDRLVRNGLGTVSPDGRLFSNGYVVQDLETGEVRRLTQPDSGFNDALTVIFDPSGDRVAYTWLGSAQMELRVEPTNPAAPRTLVSVEYRVAEGNYVIPFDWSSDGRWIAASIPSEVGNQLALVDAETGAVRALKTTALWTAPFRARFSSDDRFLIYDVSAEAHKREARDVYLLAVDGSREVRLTDHAATDTVLDWSPGGGHVVFSTNRSGHFEVWAVAVDDGNPVGGAFRVKSGLPAEVMNGSFTSDGRIFYTVRHQSFEIYQTQFDPKTQRLTAPLSLAATAAPDLNYTPVWSPEGSLAYLTQRESGYPPERQSLVVQSRDRDAERRFDITPAGAYANFGTLQWSPDGRRMAFSGFDAESRRGIFLLDPASGRTERVILASEEGAARAGWPYFSPDGRFLYYVRNDVVDLGGGSELVRLDLLSRERKSLYSVEAGYELRRPVVSPDGKWIAFDRDSEDLLIIPSGGGEATELHAASRAQVQGFTPDSKRVLFLRGTDVTERIELMTLPVTGGVPQQIESMPEGTTFIRLDSSGTKLAVETVDQYQEVRVIENLLPVIEAGASRIR